MLITVKYRGRYYTLADYDQERESVLIRDDEGEVMWVPEPHVDYL